MRVSGTPNPHPKTAGTLSAQIVMAGTDECDSAVTGGRLSKAIEFFDAAEHLEVDMPNAAGDVYVDAGIASSDVNCCIRLGTHSNSGNHNDAVALLRRRTQDQRNSLNTPLGLKNKAACTHDELSTAECKEDEPNLPKLLGWRTRWRTGRPATDLLLPTRVRHLASAAPWTSRLTAESSSRTPKEIPMGQGVRRCRTRTNPAVPRL
jgi:hypothetical protein